MKVFVMDTITAAPGRGNEAIDFAKKVATVHNRIDVIHRGTVALLLLLLLASCILDETDPGQPGTVIKGVITNDYDYPIAGATVVLHSDIQTTTTDQDGYYELITESGEHYIYAYKDGYFLRYEFTTIENEIKTVEPDIFPGFFSSVHPDKIYMLNRTPEARIKVGEEWLDVIEQYSNIDGEIQSTGTRMYVPSYDLQCTGSSSIIEIGDYVWASSVGNVSPDSNDKEYLHRYDHDLNLQESYQFANGYQYASGRFLKLKDGYLIRDDIDWVGGNPPTVQIGIRVFSFISDVPSLEKEYLKSVTPIGSYGGIEVIDMVLNGNTCDLYIRWQPGIYVTYSFDVSDPTNPAALF
ncbi:MAG: hypothetical protein ACUZ8I_12510 [Candidatus Scalindua sp.]